MGKANIVLTCGALAVILLGSICTVYVTKTQAKQESLTINNQSFTIDQLFAQTATRQFTDLNFTGIALDDAIRVADVTNPESHQYTIIGADGYQKTVTWDNLQHGLLTKQRQAVFTDLPKAFRVRDVVTIEVKSL